FRRVLLRSQRMDVNDPEELDFEINKLVENLFLKDKEEGLTEHDIKQVSNRSNDSFKILDSQKKWEYLYVSINNLYTVETNSKLEQKVIKGMIDKQVKLFNNYIINNKSFKMSDLDMEIIKNIPQGGNWRNIPQSTVNKSKRLLGIQETGGRTTLYGRMMYDKPSYTITTYFNRPGNGAYIHPVKDRVITMREGARLQGFHDQYYFFGNQRNILNQIGNAVPPFIGYLFGKKLKKLLDVQNSVDLFSGAGGLLSG